MRRAIGSLALLLTTGVGCAAHEQAMAARAAIPPAQVRGIDQPHSIVWSWPESPGQFSEVEARRFDVNDPTTNSKTPLYVVEAKDPETGQWHVVYASKKINDQWVPVQLTSSPPATQAAARPAESLRGSENQGDQFSMQPKQ